MQSNTTTPEVYIESLPADRKEAMMGLRNTIKNNIPKGFEEIMSSGMISYVVPLSLYPAGYHCTPGTPLPFLSIASQKNFIAVYHMGIYAQPDLLQWFKEEYTKQVNTKLDMGKSCIRFKKVDSIPLKLIEQLVAKVTPQEWIQVYEQTFKK
ncbi:MAG TPA: DUF1801 domain-containing protein [Chitinophagaceae bacterium]|nr:DUF1801 domain-containing protein [Chitinophagaceae bacterium]